MIRLNSRHRHGDNLGEAGRHSLRRPAHTGCRSALRRGVMLLVPSGLLLILVLLKGAVCVGGEMASWNVCGRSERIKRQPGAPGGLRIVQNVIYWNQKDSDRQNTNSKIREQSMDTEKREQAQNMAPQT